MAACLPVSVRSDPDASQIQEPRVWPAPNRIRKEESSGNETDAAYFPSVIVREGMVNKRKVPICLKLQYPMPRASWETAVIRLGTARRTIAKAALTRQFAAGQRQGLINGLGNDAWFSVRLLAAAAAAGRLGRVLLVFSHSVFLQSEPAFAITEAKSFSIVARMEFAACCLCSALVGAAAPASRAFCSASSQARW